MNGALEFTLIDLDTKTGWLILFMLGVTIGFMASYYWDAFGLWIMFFLGLIVGVFIAAYSLAALYRLTWSDLELME